MMDTDSLYKILKRNQEAKGYRFNSDKKRVYELLDALAANKKRYGYMACPCRLASGNREKDRDIICPCVYRDDDLVEYGSCFCNLYVTKDWNDKRIEHRYVPERRPPEKLFT